MPYLSDPFLVLPEIADRSIVEWPVLGTIQQLVDLSPAAFYARYLEAAQEVFGDIAIPRVVVAVVSERADLIHVLYRRDQDAVQKARRRFVRGVGTVRPWIVSVLSMRCTDTVLAVLPNYELNAEWFSKMLIFLDGDSPSSDT